MTKETALEQIKTNASRLIYLCGKTSTGKTTLAKQIVDDFGYSLIELDDIIMHSVIAPLGIKNASDAFGAAYRGLGSPEYTVTFIAATKCAIADAVTASPVIVEGSIAKASIIKEIFSGDLTDFVFLYLHPTDAEAYRARIRKRFIGGARNGTSGLPKPFWSLIDPKDLETFISTGELNTPLEECIRHYADLSIAESRERLAEFQKEFPNITIIEA